jgi:hypothetical protein
MIQSSNDAKTMRSVPISIGLFEAFRQGTSGGSHSSFKALTYVLFLFQLLISKLNLWSSSCDESSDTCKLSSAVVPLRRYQHDHIWTLHVCQHTSQRPRPSIYLRTLIDTSQSPVYVLAAARLCYCFASHPSSLSAFEYCNSII